jgi:hypothetical protein
VNWDGNTVISIIYRMGLFCGHFKGGTPVVFQRLRMAMTSRITRRRFGQLSGLAAGAALVSPAMRAATAPDIALEIAPYTLEASPKHRFKTLAYNGQVPGPLFRMRQGQEQTVEIRNGSSEPEVVHWHGLFLPPEIDGAMEEGTPMIAPGGTVRYRMTPDPVGFRWFHTHTFAGKDLTKAQYGGLHGFVLIDPLDPRDAPAAYDREVFIGLHDWGGHFAGSDDGAMSPVYDVSTMNGKMLGFGEPVRVKQGERVMMHVLNSSPTEVHWIALVGASVPGGRAGWERCAAAADGGDAAAGAGGKSVSASGDEGSRQMGDGGSEKAHSKRGDGDCGGVRGGDGKPGVDAAATTGVGLPSVCRGG